MSPLLDKILAAAAQLPPFPPVAQKAMALLSNPDVSAQELVKVIGLDPNLTTNVLKAVNSAYYSLPRRVDNLAQALALIGNKAFQEVVLTSASVRFLAKDQPGYDLSPGDLWRHSLAVALMTQVICEMIGRRPGPALYTAALMHDIGKVVLSSFVQDQVGLILREVEKGYSFIEAERVVLELDHAQLGGRIVKAWRFSQEMELLIALHHEPERKPESLELGILYLANLACQLYGLGGGLDGLAYHGREMIMKRLNFKEKDLELALAELHQRLAKAESLLALGTA